jgi:hypothetical protein
MTEKGKGSTSQELKERLNKRLEATRGKLDALKKDVSTMHAEDVQELQETRAEISKRIDEQKEGARKLHARIDTWRKEKIGHTQEAIGSWRQRHEQKKLELRAEGAEDYALNMVDVASFDLDEAEQAILDAVAARLDADAAASPAP